MGKSGRRWLLPAALVVLALAIAACTDDEDGEAAGTPSPSPTTAAMASPTVTAAPTETETPTPTPTPALSAADLQVLDGLICIGTWENETFGTSGPFAVRSELGGRGGQFTLELGGGVFGGAGGTVIAPYAVEGDAIVIEGPLDFLGEADLRLDPAGSLEGTLDAPPALGEGAMVTVTGFAFEEDEQLQIEVQIEMADGSTARSVVNADCGG